MGDSMKRLILLVFMCLCITSGLLSTGPAQGAYNLSLDTRDGQGNSKVSFSPGEDLYLHITVNDLQGLAGCAFTLNYNSSLLLAPDTDANGLPTDPTSLFSQFPFTFVKTGHPDTEAVTSRENSARVGKMLFAGASINTTTGGSKFTTSTPGELFPLFVIKFKVLSTAAIGNYTFSLSQTSLSNAAAGYAAAGEDLPLLLGAVPATDTNNWNNLSSSAFNVLVASLPAPVTRGIAIVPAPRKPVIRAISGRGGLITPEGSLTVALNSRATFTLTPAPGYSAVGVSGTCGGALAGNAYTITSVTADCTVAASFAKTDITFSENGYLAVNPDVAAAVKSRAFNSGWQHYALWGNKEGRLLSPVDYSVFDETYYLQQSPDVAAAVKRGDLSSGWQHYVLWGSKETRSARFSIFNEVAYLAANPDVAAAVKSGGSRDGWQHYVIFVLTEGREAVPAGYRNFSDDAYLAAYPDVAAAVRKGSFSNGWQHYLLFGKNEGRALSPTNYGAFNDNAYLAAYPDVEEAVRKGNFSNGWQHYIMYGINEGRLMAPAGYILFNESAYLAANPDVAAAVKNGDYNSGWDHYAKRGGKDGRPLAPAGYGLFDENAYLAANPDVAAAVKGGDYNSGWQHYTLWGVGEGRLLNPANYGSFNEGDYLAANPDVHRAVLNGDYLNGWSHYQQRGKSEGRALSWGSPLTSLLPK